jgi:hypothetical protein
LEKSLTKNDAIIDGLEKSLAKINAKIAGFQNFFISLKAFAIGSIIGLAMSGMVIALIKISAK